MASPTTPTWNQIPSWLKAMDGLRRTLVTANANPWQTRRIGADRSSLRGLEPAKGVQPNATGLTAQQERALALLAGGRRVAAVAKAVSVDRATLWRWAKLPAFRRQLFEQRLIAKRDAEAAMRWNVLLATRVLGKILRDPQVAARDRISAARVVLGAGLPSPAETWEGQLPSAEPEDRRQKLIETARRAAELTPTGAFMFARMPGTAWTDSPTIRTISTRLPSAPNGNEAHSPRSSGAP
jgi:hypothetical protein